MKKKEYNTNLNVAKSDKKDEFFTLYENVEKELINYVDNFKEKIIYCNCDNYEKSNFWKWLCENQERYQIKKIIATHYDESKSDSIKVERVAGKLFKTTILGNGDFRSDACINILKESDIVITNPPFSLFREFFDLLMALEKDFLVVGSINMLSYKNVFKEIKNNKVWLGCHSGQQVFEVPDDYNKDNVFINEHGQKFAKFGNTCWFTTLEMKKRNELLPLKEEPHEYVKYDNFNAISIDRVKDIPAHYDGLMGVPITFLEKYNPAQFDIIGADFDLAESVTIDGVIKKKPQRFYVNGKRKYARIIIKSKT